MTRWIAPALFLIAIVVYFTVHSLGWRIGTVRTAIHRGNPALIQAALNDLLAEVEQQAPLPWAGPYDTPASVRGRRRVAETLAPFQNDLLEVAAAPDRNNAGVALSILGYSPGTPQAYRVLRDILAAENGVRGELAGRCYFALYQMGLADAGIRSLFAEKIADYAQEEGYGAAFDLLRTVIYVPSPEEALPTYLRMLRSSRSSEVTLAAQALSQMGSGGRVAVPELECAADRLAAENADSLDIHVVRDVARKLRRDPN